MSLFSIGVSGLNAAQNALYTTGNNISNVYTPGYNREIVVLGENHAGGVKTDDIQRQFSQFVTSQLNASSSKLSSLQAYDTQISQVDNLLADQDAGLAPLMNRFFSSLEDLAGAPSDPAARQGVLGAADALTAQFRSLDGYLNDMQQGINGQIRDEVVQINNTAEQIAGLNREIGLAKANTGNAPNNLLNQRDQLVAELSQRADVKLTIQDGNTYNLTIGNGQPLVAGSQSYQLEAMGSPADSSRLVVGYNDSAGNLIELKEDTLKGGTLGGLLDFRSETLDKTQDQLGQLAVSFAKGFNEQHKQGLDLDGNQGKDFFSVDESSKRAAGSLRSNIVDTAEIAAGLDDAEAGSGDNRNALALQDLQSKPLVGGNATLNQAYGALVSDVGSRTSVVKVNLAAQQGLNEQLRGLQQSESGVNLDEEAANLLRFQQYYQANAKVIEVGTTIIDTILGLRT